jgi:hypothetical protein
MNIWGKNLMKDRRILKKFGRPERSGRPYILVAFGFS